MSLNPINMFVKSISDGIQNIVSLFYTPMSEQIEIHGIEKIFELNRKRQILSNFLDMLHNEEHLERIGFSYPISPFRQNYQIVAFTTADKRFVYTKINDERGAWNLYLDELQEDDLDFIIHELNRFNVLDKLYQIWCGNHYDEQSAHFYYSWEDYGPDEYYLVKASKYGDYHIRKMESN